MVMFSPVLSQYPRFSSHSRHSKIDEHLAKTRLPAFQDAYNQTFANAETFIRASLQRGETGFVIFDIDETTLDNRGFFEDTAKQYYKKGDGLASIGQGWENWVKSTDIPVIEPAKKLIEFLNDKKVPYVFLTGIRDNLQPFSEENLRKQGVWGDSCLGAYYRPQSYQGNTASFKALKRPELERVFGLPVMATVGDQPGDMVSDSRRNFKLPDYVKALRRENDNR